MKIQNNFEETTGQLSAVGGVAASPAATRAFQNIQTKQMKDYAAESGVPYETLRDIQEGRLRTFERKEEMVKNKNFDQPIKRITFKETTGQIVAGRNQLKPQELIGSLSLINPMNPVSLATTFTSDVIAGRSKKGSFYTVGAAAGFQKIQEMNKIAPLNILTPEIAMAKKQMAAQSEQPKMWTYQKEVEDELALFNQIEERHAKAQKSVRDEISNFTQTPFTTPWPSNKQKEIVPFEQRGKAARIGVSIATAFATAPESLATYYGKAEPFGVILGYSYIENAKMQWQGVTADELFKQKQLVPKVTNTILPQSFIEGLGAPYTSTDPRETQFRKGFTDPSTDEFWVTYGSVAIGAGFKTVSAYQKGDTGFGTKYLKLRAQKFDVPTVGGKETLWKGLTIESTGGRAQPLFGFTKTGFQLGTPKIDLMGAFEKSLPAGSGVLYETSTQGKILSANLPREAGFVDVEGYKFPSLSQPAFKEASRIASQLENQKSMDVRISIFKQTKSLNQASVGDVLEYARKTGYTYGSFASQQQIAADILARRGFAGDIDIQTTFASNARARSAFTPYMESIRAKGEVVRFATKDTALVESLRNAKYVHAVDIHTKETLAQDVISPDFQANYAYGLKLNQPTIKIEGTKFQVLSENVVRKYASDFTIRKSPEGKLYFGAEPYRAKDVGDFAFYSEELFRSRGMSPSQAQANLGTFKSFYGQEFFNPRTPIANIPELPSPPRSISPSIPIAIPSMNVTGMLRQEKSPSTNLSRSISRSISFDRSIQSLSVSVSPSRSISKSLSISPSQSISKSSSASISRSISKSLSKSLSLSSMSISPSPSQSLSPSRSISNSISQSISRSISPSMSPSPSPSPSRSITRDFIIPPPAIKFDLGNMFKQTKGERRKKRERTYAYRPTLRAFTLGIRGKAPKGALTGLEERPIQVPNMKWPKVAF